MQLVILEEKLGSYLSQCITAQYSGVGFQVFI